MACDTDDREGDSPSPMEPPLRRMFHSWATGRRHDLTLPEALGFRQAHHPSVRTELRPSARTALLKVNTVHEYLNSVDIHVTVLPCPPNTRFARHRLPRSVGGADRGPGPPAAQGAHHGRPHRGRRAPARRGRGVRRVDDAPGRRCAAGQPGGAVRARARQGGARRSDDRRAVLQGDAARAGSRAVEGAGHRRLPAAARPVPAVPGNLARHVGGRPAQPRHAPDHRGPARDPPGRRGARCSPPRGRSMRRSSTSARTASWRWRRLTDRGHRRASRTTGPRSSSVSDAAPGPLSDHRRARGGADLRRGARPVRLHARAAVRRTRPAAAVASSRKEHHEGSTVQPIRRP